jgi:hypothetical protein
MALLTPKTPVLAGLLLGAVAANVGGDTFANTGKEFFYIKNGGGGAITVTFDSPGTCVFGLAANSAHDNAVSVGAGEEKIIGPFPTVRFNDASGLVSASYSGVGTVTVAVLSPVAA